MVLFIGNAHNKETRTVHTLALHFKELVTEVLKSATPPQLTAEQELGHLKAALQFLLLATLSTH